MHSEGGHETSGKVHIQIPGDTPTVLKKKKKKKPGIALHEK